MSIEFNTNNFEELSNFYCGAPLIFRGNAYASSEHLYQAMKYAYFDDGKNSAYADMVNAIRAQKTPYKAKTLASMRRGGRFAWQVSLGEKAKLYAKHGVKLDARWDGVKVRIMDDVLRLKFWSDRKARDVLMSTGPALLIERTDTDSFWGDGTDRLGRNELGKLLVAIRDEWREHGVPKEAPLVRTNLDHS